MNLKNYIDIIEDFPNKGISFKDISPLLANGRVLHYVVSKMTDLAKDADVIIGPDARGFLFGTPVASNLKKPFVMIRKEKKLPGKVIRKEFAYEYGKKQVLEIQANRVHHNQKAIIIDDVLATGGTTEAMVNLIEEQGGIVKRIIVLMELEEFKSREKFEKRGIEIISLIKF